MSGVLIDDAVIAPEIPADIARGDHGMTGRRMNTCEKSWQPPRPRANASAAVASGLVGMSSNVISSWTRVMSS